MRKSIFFSSETLQIAKLKLEQLEGLRSEDTPTASWLPTPLSHIGSQVKRRQSQSYKFKKFAKISNYWILKQALHTTHLLKLLDKKCKYEMDPMGILEDTERTRFCPQTDRRRDGRTDRRTRWYQYTPPFNFVEAGGYKKNHHLNKMLLISLCILEWVPRTLFYLYDIRDHFVHAHSQWETTLHCNVVSHWLGA